MCFFCLVCVPSQYVSPACWYPRSVCAVIIITGATVLVALGSSDVWACNWDSCGHQWLKAQVPLRWTRTASLLLPLCRNLIWMWCVCVANHWSIWMSLRVDLPVEENVFLDRKQGDDDGLMKIDQHLFSDKWIVIFWAKKKKKDLPSLRNRNWQFHWLIEK